MRMIVSNFVWKNKFKYEDIQDMIIGEEVRRRDAGEAFCSDSDLNLKTRGRGQDKNYGQGRLKSRKGRSKSIFGQQPKCWNCSKTGHYKKNCREPRKENENEFANTVTEEVHDALLLYVDSPLDSWVLDSIVSFHMTMIYEILRTMLVEILGRCIWLTN